MLQQGGTCIPGVSGGTAAASVAVPAATPLVVLDTALPRLSLLGTGIQVRPVLVPCVVTMHVGQTFCGVCEGGARVGVRLGRDDAMHGMCRFVNSSVETIACPKYPRCCA